MYLMCVKENTKSKLVGQRLLLIARYPGYWSIHNLSLFNNYIIYYNIL